MIPVSVEHLRDFIHDGTECEHIEVAEIYLRIDGVVFLGDIPPANNRRLVVDRERLVMHAPIDAFEVRDPVQYA